MKVERGREGFERRSRRSRNVKKEGRKKSGDMRVTRELENRNNSLPSRSNAKEKEGVKQEMCCCCVVCTGGPSIGVGNACVHPEKYLL